jgi:hypothetical protein
MTDDGLVDHEVAIAVGRLGSSGRVDEILVTGETVDAGEDEGAWALPTIHFRAESEATEPLADAVERLLGRSSPILRATWAWYAAEEDREDAEREAFAAAGPERRYVELEPIETEAPPGLRWAPWRDLGPAALRPVDLREAFEAWTSRQADGPGLLEPPWSRPGWFDRASAWMVERMVERGRPPTAPPRLHYMWAL